MPNRPTNRAFSLIELVIVVVIIGIIGAIAIPRMSSAADSATTNAMIADHVNLQKAIDLYTEEHAGNLPHVGAASQKIFVLRLLSRTDLAGDISASGHLGPYIDRIPYNRVNGLRTIRRAGAAAGANTHGWRYTVASGLIEPDHTPGDTARSKDKGVADVTPEEIGDALKGILP